MREEMLGRPASGYSVQTGTDGQAAVELFTQRSSSGLPFRAVLLDLTVAGGMGGKEAAQLLRKMDPSVPLFDQRVRRRSGDDRSRRLWFRGQPV